MSDSQKSRLSVGSRAGTVGLCINIALFAGKLAAGVLSGSVSVTADAMNNLSDASSSLVTLLGFKLALKPADADHPYGHARFEYLSALGVAVLILFIGFELARSAILKILAPAPVALHFVTVAVLVASIVIKLWLWLFYRRQGKKIGSDALLAAATDSRNDVVATAAVLAAAVIEHFSGLQVDGWMGLGVSLFILYSGFVLARATVSPLLGEAVDPALREQILDQIRSQPKILGYHDLLVHDYGPGRRFASVHVEMDRREDPLACHEIIDALERECLHSHNVQLLIHYDPVVVGDPEQEQLRVQLTDILHQLHPDLTFHDLRTLRLEQHTDLFFDISIPPEMAGQEDTIRRTVEQQLRSGDTCYRPIITFDVFQ